MSVISIHLHQLWVMIEQQQISVFSQDVDLNVDFFKCLYLLWFLEFKIWPGDQVKTSTFLFIHNYNNMNKRIIKYKLSYILHSYIKTWTPLCAHRLHTVRQWGLSQPRDAAHVLCTFYKRPEKNLFTDVSCELVCFECHLEYNLSDGRTRGLS